MPASPSVASKRIAVLRDTCSASALSRGAKAGVPRVAPLLASAPHQRVIAPQPYKPRGLVILKTFGVLTIFPK